MSFIVMTSWALRLELAFNPVAILNLRKNPCNVIQIRTAFVFANCKNMKWKFQSGRSVYCALILRILVRKLWFSAVLIRSARITARAILSLKN